MATPTLIESILFAKAEPVSKATLAHLLNVSKEEVEAGLRLFEEALVGRGIQLIRNGEEVMLATAPQASALIQKLTEEELSADLGKAGLETLAIVLYNGPISKSRIDYIRGVNSSYILRHLLVRGLVLREADLDDKRVFLYRPTFDTLRYLGVKSVTELPEYDASRARVKTFEEAFNTESLKETPSNENIVNEDQPHE